MTDHEREQILERFIIIQFTEYPTSSEMMLIFIIHAYNKRKILLDYSTDLVLNNDKV
jgi:hypothetical protein